jgi:outer membrane receptor for ferric coprogen and ferric-rhodotorulic acid
VLDLSLGFRPTNHIDLQLNANNLFDKRYYQGITAVVTQGNSVYGAPRNVMLTGRYTF